MVTRTLTANRSIVTLQRFTASQTIGRSSQINLRAIFPLTPSPRLDAVASISRRLRRQLPSYCNLRAEMTIMSGIFRYSDWILRVLLVILFGAAGIMKLIEHPFELRSFAHFGYSSWFMYAIGILELAAALLLLDTRFILPAAALLGAVLVGAIYSHLMVGDAFIIMAPAVIALVMLAGLVALHWPSGPKSKLS